MKTNKTKHTLLKDESNMLPDVPRDSMRILTMTLWENLPEKVIDT